MSLLLSTTGIHYRYAHHGALRSSRQERRGISWPSARDWENKQHATVLGVTTIRPSSVPIMVCSSSPPSCFPPGKDQDNRRTRPPTPSPQVRAEPIPILRVRRCLVIS
ncbi:hypothetical protein VTI74DRAFT_4053 [Chaetomium olivicolor]